MVKVRSRPMRGLKGHGWPSLHYKTLDIAGTVVFWGDVGLQAGCLTLGHLSFSGINTSRFLSQLGVRGASKSGKVCVCV